MMSAAEKSEKLEAQLRAAEDRLTRLKSAVRDSQTILDIRKLEVDITAIKGNLNTAKNESDMAKSEYEKTKTLTGMELPKESLMELSSHNIDDLLNGELVMSMMDTEAPLRTADLTARLVRLSVRVAGKGNPITISLAPDLMTFLARNAGTIIDLLSGHRAKEARRAKQEAIASRVAWDKQNPHVATLGNTSYQMYEEKDGRVVIISPSGQPILLYKVPLKEKPATIKINGETWLIYFNEKEDNFTLTNAATGAAVVSVRAYRMAQKRDKENARRNFAIAVRRLDWAGGLVKTAQQKLDEAMAWFAMGLIKKSDIDNYEEAKGLSEIELALSLRDYGKAKFDMTSYGVRMTDEEAKAIPMDQNAGYYIHRFTAEAWARATDKLTADQEAELSKVIAWRDSLQSFEFGQYVSAALSTQSALILPQGGAFSSKNAFAIISVRLGEILGGLRLMPR